MDTTITINGRDYGFDTSKPYDISLSVGFDAPGIRVFGAPPPHSIPYKSGDFIADVDAGAWCNCDVLTVIPHCHGTHTETIGHIADRPVYITDTMPAPFIPATVISIAPVPAMDSGEHYDPVPQGGDMMITAAHLEDALAGFDPDFLTALVIRTLPNDESKKTRNYDDTSPPYFSREAMTYIAARHIKHLLVDMPSVDRLADEGKLTAHHIFWSVSAGTHDIGAGSDKTITELVYVPDTIKDGEYILNLQVAPLQSDAAPSRPLLFEVNLL